MLNAGMRSSSDSEENWSKNKEDKKVEKIKEEKKKRNKKKKSRLAEAEKEFWKPPNNHNFPWS
jgi:hypothetical protein